MEIQEILQLSPIIPVVTIKNARDAVQLARTLLAAGVNVIEITMRTPAAVSAIRAVNDALPNMMVGAGTLLEPAQFEEAKKAGARFLVSPGVTPPLVNAAKQVGLPYLPGAITPCEIMAAKQLGFNVLKFFPAELAGGIPMLKAMAPVFPDIQFCPTGGITRTNMRDYLALENVIAVGGTWIAPENLIANQDWDGIGVLAREAVRAETV